MSITIFSAVRTEYFQVRSYCFWSPFPGEFIRQIKLILGWQNLCLTSVFAHRAQHDIFCSHGLLLFSRSVVSDSLQPYGLQHARLPCPSPSPRDAQTHVHWVSEAIHPSHPLLPSSSPAFNLSEHQGFFPMSHLFALGGWSIRASASVSVLPMNIQGWFPLGLTGLISFLSKGLSRVFTSTTAQKHQFYSAKFSL